MSLPADALAKKCIHDHRNPIVKIALPSHKHFFAVKNNEEKAVINEYQNKFMTMLEHQKVEKRSNRAQAVWVSDKKVAQVTKVIKNLVRYFGYQNKDGVFLYPEEMLYLIETNRLEVTFADTYLSIEKAYELVLKTTGVNLATYRIYKKLATFGYKVIRYEQIRTKTISKEQQIKTKRNLEKLNDHIMQNPKKIKTMPEPQKIESDTTIEPLQENSSSPIIIGEVQSETPMTEEVKYILNIFNHLRKDMPMEKSQKSNVENPDYCIFAPPNILRANPDFNLFICDKDIISRTHFTSEIPSIFAICTDDVSFYKFSDIHLPYM